MRKSLFIFICITVRLLLVITDTYAINTGEKSLWSDESYSSNSFETITVPNSVKSQWFIETSLSFPIARIYMIKFSFSPTDKAELGMGPAFQNWKNLDVSPLGRANAYTLVISYRYYFWRNFNAEIEFWPAWNHFESFMDGKTYKGPELWVEYKVGYKWEFARRFYLNIQPGIGHALWLQQNWPGVDKTPYLDFVKGSIIFVPQVLWGWNL
jgi:hypothetical protein